MFGFYTRFDKNLYRIRISQNFRSNHYSQSQKKPSVILSGNENALRQSIISSLFLSRFHPGVARIFLSYLGSKERPISVHMSKLKKWSVELLTEIKGRGHKNHNKLMRVCYLGSKIDHRRGYVGDVVASILKDPDCPEVKSKKDLDMVAASLRILMPRSDKSWLEIDDSLAKLNSKKLINIESAIIFSHVLLTSLIENAFNHIEFQSIQHFLNRADEIKELFSSICDETYKPIVPKTIKTPFGDVETEVLSDSQFLEKFGMYVEVLAYANRKSTITSPENIDFSQFYKCIKSSSNKSPASPPASSPSSFSDQSSDPSLEQLDKIPIRFLTLCHVIKYLSRLPYRESAQYNSFTDLIYQQIIWSIKADQFQLLNEEREVTNLLGSMTLTVHSSCYPELIELIWTFYRDRGCSFKDLNSKFFDILVELNAIGAALEYLDLMIEKSNALDDHLLLPVKNTGLQISQKSKTRILNKLESNIVSANKQHKIDDLILSLFCFSRDTKISDTYRFLEGFEHAIIPHLTSCSPAKALKILNGYALVGRKHIDVIEKINVIIGSEYTELKPIQVSKLLWSNGRLNNRANYNAGVARIYLNYIFETKSVMSRYGTNEAIRTIWAMALLQVISIEVKDT
jgi:hypothetical protein